MRIFLFALHLFIWSGSAQSEIRKPFSKKRFESLSGKKASRNEKIFWDSKFSKSQYVFGKAPASFLAENYHYIRPGGSVLDMGMGEGRNAVFLAQKGFSVTGIDISSVAVKKAEMLAKEFGVRIKTIVASLNSFEFKPKTFDAILCFYYVDRSLISRMMKWLKPGGVIVYESYTDNQRKLKGHEHHNPKYLLREGELLRLFEPKMRVLKYEEPLHKQAYTSSIILKKI